MKVGIIMTFKQLCAVIHELGCRFVGVRKSDKGSAVEIAYGSTEQKDGLTELSAKVSGTFIEHKGEYWNLQHQPVGENYTDAQGITKVRPRDRFTLLTRVTYDDFDSAVNAS